MDNSNLNDYDDDSEGSDMQSAASASDAASVAESVAESDELIEDFVDLNTDKVDIDVQQTLTIYSDQLLNVNITQHFVRTLLTLSETWRADFYASKPDDEPQWRPPAQPYFVANYTGLLVSVWHDAAASEMCTVDAGDCSLHALRGVRVPSLFDAGSHSAARTGRDQQPPALAQRRRGPTLSVQLRGGVVNFVTMGGVPLDAVGVLYARPAPDDRGAVVVCHTEARRGARVVTLRSNVVLLNTTGEPLLVRLVDAAGDVLAASDALPVLGCDERLALPVGVAHRCRVQVRPAKRREVGWSSTHIDCAALERRGIGRLLRCRAQAADAPSFDLHYGVERNQQVSMEAGARRPRVPNRFEPLHKQSGASSASAASPAPAAPRASGESDTCFDYTLVLRLPLVVINALPVPFAFRVCAADGRVVASGSVAPGKHAGVPLAAGQWREPPSVHYKVSGFAWSEPVRILTGRAGDTAVSSCAMLDDARRTLKLSVLNYINDKGVRKISLQVSAACAQLLRC